MSASVAKVTQRTIPKKQDVDPSLDHQAYFSAGLDGIRRMAHRLWTDHNIHDPGITTLEMLGYALTDLSYRASFPIEDLLAIAGDNATSMKNQFFTARQILTTKPVTTSDYRKLLIDLKGVKNAWILKATETYYADTIVGKLLHTDPGVPGIVPVHLQGLYTVLIDFMDGVKLKADQDAIIETVKQVLQANRNLCEDFVGCDRVPTQTFVLCAELEVAPDADIALVHAQILFEVQQYLAPQVNQYTLEEMLERVRPDGSRFGAEDLFDGPVLENGFIDDDELLAAELRSEIRLSDIISIIMDIPGVRAVRDIIINPADPVIAPDNKWRVAVEPGKKALLARDASRLVFYKRNMPSLAKSDQMLVHWNALTAAAIARVETSVPYDFAIPLGTYRQPARYYSFQNHFPVVYGLSPVGLVGAVDNRRTILAYQLKAYLLFFDQIMADYFAQLARVKDLFSLDFANPDLQRTYYHQKVDSFKEFAKIYRVPDVIAKIQNTIDDDDTRIGRRNRFLDHMIARFGEQFHEFVDIMASEFGFSAETMVRYKCEFLQSYPALSSQRALAYNHTLKANSDLWESENISGLERRLARLLGIPKTARRNLGEVAYDVYAEVDKTPGDEFRFRIRKRNTTKIILSSTVNYPTKEKAIAAMKAAIQSAMLPAGYQRKVDVDGRHYFNVIDSKGAVVARRIEYFKTEDAMNAAIDELMDYVRTEYSEEGMYLIESILLRPAGGTDPFLPICPDPNCTECADEDPYSYRIHIILPAYGGRFLDMDFRRWAEEIIREETPAHIQPKVCWISDKDMAAFEKLYRDWIYLRAGKETAGRLQKLTDFIHKLFHVKNVYPVQNLHECDSDEGVPKFILGQTALGTLDET